MSFPGMSEFPLLGGMKLPERLFPQFCQMMARFYEDAYGVQTDDDFNAFDPRRSPDVQQNNSLVPEEMYRRPQRRGHHPERTPAQANHPELPERKGRDVRTSERSPSKTGFAEKLLTRLNLPVSSENTRFLDAWQNAEGGSADNPFNTCQSAPGAVRFNRVGVKRYPSLEIGVEATAKALTNGHYGVILAALRHGGNAHTTALAVARTPWGTRDEVARIV